MLSCHILPKGSSYPIACNEYGYFELSDSSGLQYLIDGDNLVAEVGNLAATNEVAMWTSDVRLPSGLVYMMANNLCGDERIPSGEDICIIRTNYHEGPVIYIGFDHLEVKKDNTLESVLASIDFMLDEEFGKND